MPKIGLPAKYKTLYDEEYFGMTYRQKRLWCTIRRESVSNSKKNEFCFYLRHANPEAPDRIFVTVINFHWRINRGK